MGKPLEIGFVDADGCNLSAKTTLPFLSHDDDGAEEDDPSGRKTPLPEARQSPLFSSPTELLPLLCGSSCPDRIEGLGLWASKESSTTKAK
jgi:hypothetical protein